MLKDPSTLDAVFLYFGILEAYDAVASELIGSDVLDEHVLPRAVYYGKEFLPTIFTEEKEEDELVPELKQFFYSFKQKMEQAREEGTGEKFSMEEIWELRALIFAYESVFIEILGEVAIKNYVFKRIGDILGAYLPEIFISEDLSLKNKLEAYAKYLKANKFVGYARASIKDDQVQMAVNKCEFARIHDSEAYRNAYVRFCPWGMIASAIVSSHFGEETSIDDCLFTVKGSVSKVSSH